MGTPADSLFAISNVRQTYHAPLYRGFTAKFSGQPIRKILLSVKAIQAHDWLNQLSHTEDQCVIGSST